MPNGVFVQRQIQPTVSPPVYDEPIEGLPFYYYFDMRFCVLLIVLGIIVGIIQFLLTAGLLAFPFLRRKYICIKCKHEFQQFNNPHYCKFCKGMVVPEKEYFRRYAQLENSTDKGRIID